MLQISIFLAWSHCLHQISLCLFWCSVQNVGYCGIDGSTPSWGVEIQRNRGGVSAAKIDLTFCLSLLLSGMTNNLQLVHRLRQPFRVTMCTLMVAFASWRVTSQSPMFKCSQLQCNVTDCIFVSPALIVCFPFLFVLFCIRVKNLAWCLKVQHHCEGQTYRGTG